MNQNTKPKPPYRKRQIIAVLLLIGNAVGLITMHFLFGGQREIWQISFFHAFEGGLVGGLCDWFAVWKTYRAIEQDSDTIANEIGKWVSTDLLNSETLRFQLNSILDNPNVQAGLIHILNQHFATEEDIKSVLLSLWEKYEDSIVEYSIRYHLELKEFRAFRGSINDPHITQTIKFCMGEALIRVGESKEWRELYSELHRSSGTIARLVLNFYKNDFYELLKQYGEKILSGKGSDDSQIILLEKALDVFAKAIHEFILSWNHLDIDSKRNFLYSSFHKLVDPVASILAKFLLLHKQKLEEAKKLREYMPTRLIAEFIEKNLDQNISNVIGNKISERLKSQNPRDFRYRLEWKTRRILENIRINGTILGFVLGLVIGAILH